MAHVLVAIVKWLHAGDLQYNIEDRCGPSNWSSAIIVAIHTKGSRKVCKNYKGISLLSIPGKVFAKVISNQVRRVTEKKIMEEQAGCRSGRGCQEQIFVMRHF